MKAELLLKQNIAALLRVRGLRQVDLATWCHCSEAWLSKILNGQGSEKRGLPVVYLDRIADFLGVSPYQLFQPGISPATERRKMVDRRKGTERRIRHQQAGAGMRASDLHLTAEDVAFLLRVRSLNKADRAELEKLAKTPKRVRRTGVPSTTAAAADTGSGLAPRGIAQPLRK